MLSSDSIAFTSDAGHYHRIIETLADSKTRDSVVEKSGAPCKANGSVWEFEVGVEVLAAHGAAFNKGRMWPAFDSYFCEPRRMNKANHSRYELWPSTGRVTRKAIHARRIFYYKTRPTHLLN